MKNVCIIIGILLICQNAINPSQALPVPIDDDKNALSTQLLSLVNEKLENESLLQTVNRFIRSHGRSKRQLNIIQSKIVDIVHPKPIVDTMREEDKYGNTVDHAFGRKIVKAVEGLSNIINNAFAYPVKQVRKATKSATDALNQIGGRIVGLQE